MSERSRQVEITSTDLLSEFNNCPNCGKQLDYFGMSGADLYYPFCMWGTSRFNANVKGDRHE